MLDKELKIHLWNDKNDPLAQLDDVQLDILNRIDELSNKSAARKVQFKIFKFCLFNFIN
jgi:hypothetical protein